MGLGNEHKSIYLRSVAAMFFALSYLLVYGAGKSFYYNEMELTEEMCERDLPRNKECVKVYISNDALPFRLRNSDKEKH